IELRGNLNPASDKHTADTIIKDSLGNSWIVELEFKKGTEENTWKMSPKSIHSQDGERKIEVGKDQDQDKAKLNGTTTITFGTDGKINTEALELKLNIPDQNGATFGEGGSITIFDPNNPDSYNKMTQYA